MGTGGANMLNQIPSSLPPVSTATPPNIPQPPVSTATPPNMGLLQAQQLMGQPQQQQQGHGTTYPPGYAPTPYHEISGLNPTLGDSVNWKAFTDTVFDKLGPDMVYKMTPHQLGTLSAYMYLKLS